MRSCDFARSCVTNMHQIMGRTSPLLLGRAPSMIWEVKVGASTDSELVGSQISSGERDRRRDSVSDYFAQGCDTKSTGCTSQRSRLPCRCWNSERRWWM